nr:hypothetical protein [Micromonospora sp. DSM 115978]
MRGSASRRVATVMAASTLAAAAALLAPSPAMAHTVCASPGSGGGDGCVGSTHIWVDACDYSADGWGIRTYYYLQSNPNYPAGHVGDGNGSASGCGTSPVGTSSNPVVKIYVCAGPNGQNLSCGVTKTA